MIDDLSRHLDHEKRKDLVNRLNNKRVEQCLPAEMELALIWTLRELDLEVEPVWWANGKKPDVYVEGLIPDTPTVIEITAVADNTMSGEPQMDHCATQLISIANSAKRGFGDYLYFQFAETSNYRKGRDERGIAAPIDYTPSEKTKSTVKAWIESGPTTNNRLILQDGDLHVALEKREHKQTRFHNVHVSRPPRVYSETKNPIYSALTKKASQVADAPQGAWRVIFLVEAGSRLLSEVSQITHNYGVERHSTAKSIIHTFMKHKRDKVDAVVVFVPIKQFQNGFLTASRYNRKWDVTVFGEENSTNKQLLQALDAMIIQLPKPQFDGFNARSLTRQNAMRHDARGWYLPTTTSLKNRELTYKMSLRAFQDFLSKRIDEKQFRQFIGDQDNGPNIQRFLDNGYTIQNIRFASGGVDRDDDYVIFEFAKDAAASPFE